MKPEEMRVKIATYLFPQFPVFMENGALRHRYPGGDSGPAHNYPADLNAMHEAEKTLDRVQTGLYRATLAGIMAKSEHTFDPCDYGDPYTKKTCIWSGGGFVMPPKNRIEPTEGSKMHLMTPGADRANLRSATPMGFARAVFEANSKHLAAA